MRRYIPAYCVPVLLLLAACDQSPQSPDGQAATETPETAPIEAAAPEPAPAAAAPVAEPDTAPLFGTWAADLGWCDGNGEGFPITIAADRFEGRENSCDVARLDDNGDGSFTATLSCTGEGEGTTERVVMTPLFGPTGEGIRLDYLDRGGEPVNVFRC